MHLKHMALCSGDSCLPSVMRKPSVNGAAVILPCESLTRGCTLHSSVLAHYTASHVVLQVEVAVNPTQLDK
uniref:Uncharacterized protein n=1 Tax=Anguilla anguilla TaxID=7936 RepID=A0A0E9VLD4_ANGAN